MRLISLENSAFYIVNIGAVVDKYFEAKAHLPRVVPHYGTLKGLQFNCLILAVKSNPDIAIVRTLALLGAGFDCASKPELEEVLSIGVQPERIIFANPTKAKGTASLASFYL